MFSNLADSLDKTFRNLRGVGKISESNITEALRDIRLALLEADVEFSVAKEFVAHVKEQAMGADVLKSIKPGEQIVKIFHDELAELLGGDQVPLDLTPPARIMLCGLNGAGKTTTAGKLANRLKKEGRKPLLVADSATGQQAVSVAKHFDEAVGITGIILTKLDGDARGGAALSMRAVTGKPIKFAGEGEKLDQLFEFHPNRMADRILGMGDIVGMVEQVASKIDEKDAMKSMQRLAEGKFDFYDFLDQMKMLQKLGDMKGLLGLLPGFNKIKKQIPDAAFDPKRMKRTEAIVLSMTPDERRRPEIIKQSRRERIAKGSGTKLVEVNQLLKQFGEMRKMMRSPNKMNKMMKQMGGGMGGMPNLPGMGGKGGLGGMDINEMMKSMKGKFPF
jgi:signal recognition particle subunit SRP54